MTWPRVPLEALAHGVDYGLTASASADPEGPAFLRITDIQDGQVNWTAVPSCKCSQEEEGRNSLSPGDIVFARTGATTGKSFLVRSCPARTVFASYLIRVRPKSQVIPAYLAHFFQTRDYWAQVSRSATGTAQAGVNASNLRRLRIPLPPLEEQKRIAAVLDKAEALRRKRQESLAKLDTLVQSVFLDMFGDPVTNPRRWPEAELRGHLTFLTSGSRGWATHYADHGSLFLRIQNVGRGGLRLDDVAYVQAPPTTEARRTRVIAGDVLLSITADLGRTAVVPEGIGPAYINQHLALLRLSRLDPTYAAAFLASRSGQQQIRRLNREGVKAGLNFEDIRSLRLLVPPADAQERFAAVSVKITQTRRLLVCAGNKAQRLFASLQAASF